MKVDIEAEQAAILKIDKKWAFAAPEGRDIERIVSFWTDDATVFPRGFPEVVGKDAIRQYVAGISKCRDSADAAVVANFWHRSFAKGVMEFKGSVARNRTAEPCCYVFR